MDTNRYEFGSIYSRRKLMRLGCHLEIKKKCVLKSYKKWQPSVLKAKCTASASHSKYRRWVQIRLHLLCDILKITRDSRHQSRNQLKQSLHWFKFEAITQEPWEQCNLKESDTYHSANNFHADTVWMKTLIFHLWFPDSTAKNSSWEFRGSNAHFSCFQAKRIK